MELNDDRLFKLQLNRMQFLRPAERHRIVNELGSLKALSALSRSALQSFLGRPLLARRWRPESYLREVERDISFLTRGTMSCIFHGDDAFPPRLREIYDPPVVLFYRGTLPDNSRPLIAIVGTRRPTGRARNAAFGLGLEFSQAGICVVSGLARGIDVEAHEGCLEGRAAAVAVLGSGFSHIYPRSNLKVAARILDNGGVLLSEYPLEYAPEKNHFPARNRIISGLSRAVVVVQAPQTSGALITGEFALSEGRDLFVHSAGLNGAIGRGSAKLAEDGAPVIDSARPILAEWHVATGRDARGSRPGVSGGVQGYENGTAGLVVMEMAGGAVFHNGRFFRKDIS